MASLDDLAKQIDDLRVRLDGLTRPAQLGNSSIAQGGETIDLSAAASTAVDTPAFLESLQQVLDANEQALDAAKDDVEAAIAAAQEASDAGVAAGEEASAAADDALVKAQQALDAAAAAGGGATYTNRAPTTDDPGTPGKQWFVWDAGYHVTSYYVYKDDTAKWVQAVLDDGTFGNLSAGRITSGFLDAARIAAGSLTAAVLAADTLTSREIGADAILARNIKAAEITGDKIAARTIAAGNIVANTITGAEIKANSITASQIAANSITANEINLDTLNGKTINGLTIIGASIKTAASGTRAELSGTGVAFYDSSNAKGGSISAGAGKMLFLTGLESTPALTVGTVTVTNGSQATATMQGGTDIQTAHVGSVVGRTNGVEFYNDPNNLMTVSKARLTSTADASLTSSSHAFQIGDDASTNLIIDQNEIMVRNSAGNASLYINTDGGNVGLGDTTSTITVPGILSSAFGANRIAVGQYSQAALANSASNTTNITWPAGRFTRAPVVFAIANNSRYTVASGGSTSTTGGSLTVSNWSGAAGTAATSIWWVAIQMSEGNTFG